MFQKIYNYFKNRNTIDKIGKTSKTIGLFYALLKKKFAEKFT